MTICLGYIYNNKMYKLIIIFLLLSIPAFANTHTPAQDITVNTSSFSKNLNASDTDVQTALGTLDQLNASGGSSGVNWGGIGGTLSNQTDLQNALNAKISSQWTTQNTTDISFAGGNVGIGTTNPQGALTVMNGNVGIGTWISPSSLQVIGGGTATELVNKGYELIMPSPTLSTPSEVDAMTPYQGAMYTGYDGGVSAPIYKWDGNKNSLFYTLGTGTDFQAVGAEQTYAGNLYASTITNFTGSAGIYVYNPNSTVSNFVQFPSSPGSSSASAITVPNDSTHNAIFGSTSYSVEYYGRIDDLGASSDGFMASKFSASACASGSPGGFKFGVQASRVLTVGICVGNSDKVTLTNTSAFTSGGYHDFIFSWTNTAAPIIYVDGVAASLASSTTVTTPDNDTGNVFTIGNYPANSRAFAGTFRRLRIWRNYAVTSGDATTLAAGGTIGTSPTGQYLFTEGTGTTTADSSGNNNTGTLVGSVLWNNTTFDLSFNNGSEVAISAMIVFKGQLIAGGGYGESRVYGFNGKTWTTLATGLGASVGNIQRLYVYKGNLFAITQGGGVNAGIYSSPDGTNWTEENTAAGTNFIEFRGHLYALQFNNILLERNDVAGTWFQVLNTLPNCTQDYGLDVYNDNLYVGCTTASGGAVYKSYDGQSFNLDFLNNQQGGRGTEVFAMSNYDGSMYIGMGFSGNTKADIWRKTDSLGQLMDTANQWINRLTFNNTSGYNWNDDTFLVQESTPWNFESNVGIGTIAPGQALDVQGTVRTKAFNLSSSPTTGYVLTSDANGNGTWQVSTGSGSNYWNIYAGNVGIGTTNNVGIGSTVPGGSLDVGTGTICLNHTCDSNWPSTTYPSGTGIVTVSSITSWGTTLTAPSGTIVGTSDTQTLTNKKLTKRIVTASDATSVTPNSDNADITYQSNSQTAGTLTINADAGASQTNGQSWVFKIKSTNIQTFSWNSVYVGGTISLPTSSTGSGKIDYFAFIYDSVNNKWDYTGNVTSF